MYPGSPLTDQGPKRPQGFRRLSPGSLSKPSKAEKVEDFRDWDRSRDRSTTDPGNESLPADSALGPGSLGSRRRSGMWGRTSGSSPTHPKSAERSEKCALSTEQAPESRTTRCRPSNYRRKRISEEGPTRQWFALLTIKVRVPDHSPTTLH